MQTCIQLLDQSLARELSRAPASFPVKSPDVFTAWQSAGIPGPPTGWAWDFGEGGSSTAQHPEYTYNMTGTFTVTLTVSNGDVTNALTMPSYITVREESKIYLPLVLRNP